jgi:hypothetical protein
MLRTLVCLGLLCSATACGMFSDYRVDISDPTAKTPSPEAPYYDYNREETIYTHRGPGPGAGEPR